MTDKEGGAPCHREGVEEAGRLGVAGALASPGLHRQAGAPLDAHR